MGGEILYLAHVSNVSGTTFHEGLRELIAENNGKNLYTEIQYQTTIQPDGQALFSALVIGRIKEEA